jgi:TPR repeat protein
VARTAPAAPSQTVFTTGAQDDEFLEKMYISARFLGDKSACKKLIDLAESGNNLLAVALLATSYMLGSTVLPKDTVKATSYAAIALPWLQSEAALGNKYAQCNLGSFLLDGNGIGKDEANAVRYYKLAADQGHANAQCSLGESCDAH